MRAMRLPIAVAIVLSSIACARLPDYAQPQVKAMAPGTYAVADAIRYRPLTRADFRAGAPPAGMAAHAERMGAYTCAAVVPTAAVQIRIEPAGGGFVAHAENLSVHAEMDRGCSWWNESPKTTQTPAYILQHEQIHFAIVELAARDMRARGQALRARGATVEAARAAFQHELDELLRTTLRSLQARSLAFDEDTSMAFRTDVQQKWYDRVVAELAAS